jgi:hypothetical protein
LRGKHETDELDSRLEALRAEGVKIDPKREDYAYGRFAWLMDSEGNRIELWSRRRRNKANETEKAWQEETQALGRSAKRRCFPWSAFGSIEPIFPIRKRTFAT